MIKKVFCKTWDLMCSHGLLLGGGATGVLALFTLFKSSFSLDGWQVFGLIIAIYFIIFLRVFVVNFIQIKYGKEVDKVNAPDVIGIQVLLNFEKDTQKVIAGKLHIDKALQRLCDGVKVILISCANVNVSFLLK